MTTAILLINLGTPAAPTPEALRSYLAEFLWDRRVVDLPRLPWWLILHGIILRTRPAKSAAKYAKVWTDEGSPLKVHTERQAKLLRGYLGERGRRETPVAWAMRYGAPSVGTVLDELQQAGVNRVIVLPLYPQFSNSTTASSLDAVQAWQARNPDGPRIESISGYHDHPAYIEALAASIEGHWQRNGRADRLLMSFHGIPQRAADKGDPYPEQCRETAALLAARLQLTADSWLLTFQSRFGPAQWLQPYTQATLEQLASEGLKSVDVVCPGFSADCLETLEEISLECRTAFLGAGGGDFRYIPCLNEDDAWIAALTDIVFPRLD
jgi:ferrochelatase